MFEDPFRCQLR